MKKYLAAATILPQFLTEKGNAKSPAFNAFKHKKGFKAMLISSPERSRTISLRFAQRTAEITFYLRFEKLGLIIYFGKH